MTKIALPVVAATLVNMLPLMAQNADSLSKPLSEAEVNRTIDSFGTGNPVRRAPLSVADPASGDARRESKEIEAKKPPQGKGPTEITAQEASFDQKAHQAVFAGDVVVKNPEFNITCEKLTAFLRNEEKDKAAPAAPKPATTPAPAPAKPAAKASNAGGLEKVIAEGSVVITQDKVDADGKVSRSVGRSRRAVYDSATGDVVLTGRPSLQQGINTIVATDDGTIMTLNREGRLKINGPSTTMIQETPENPTAANGR